jgi:hypothetical protein
VSRATLLTLLADAAREREWLNLGEPNREDLAGVTVVLAFIETHAHADRSRSRRSAGRQHGGVRERRQLAQQGETLLDTVRLFRRWVRARGGAAPSSGAQRGSRGSSRRSAS